MILFFLQLMMSAVHFNGLPSRDTAIVISTMLNLGLQLTTSVKVSELNLLAFIPRLKTTSSIGLLDVLR